MQSFQQKYLILSAQTYRMQDESTGELREGISLGYIPDDNLEPYEDAEALKRGQVSRGKKVAKMALPIELQPKLKEFPGIYNVTLEFSIVGQKQQVRPKDIDFVSSVKLIQNNSKQ